MAYYQEHGNSGCGCYIAIILFLAVISGIRSCVTHLIDGDIKLPQSGSRKINGGTGGYGTSNGYNIQYPQTTSPNHNSSPNDYSHTNNQPTQYVEGARSSNHASSITSDNKPSSNSLNKTIQNNSNSSTQADIINPELLPSVRQNVTNNYRTCSLCNGTGKQVKTYWHYGEEHPLGGSVIRCGSCERTDTHTHQMQEKCDKCWGKGKVLVIYQSGMEFELPIMDNY